MFPLLLLAGIGGLAAGAGGAMVEEKIKAKAAAPALVTTPAATMLTAGTTPANPMPITTAPSGAPVMSGALGSPAAPVVLAAGISGGTPLPLVLGGGTFSAVAPATPPVLVPLSSFGSASVLGGGISASGASGIAPGFGASSPFAGSMAGSFGTSAAPLPLVVTTPVATPSAVSGLTSIFDISASATPATTSPASSANPVSGAIASIGRALGF